MKAGWQLADTDESLEEDLAMEMEERRKEKEKRRRHAPGANTVLTWRRFFLRLEKLSQSQPWQKQLQDWKL